MRLDEIAADSQAPDMQAGFELIARLLLSDWTRRIIGHGRANDIRYLDDLPAGSVEETFQHRRHMRRLPEKLQKFVKHMTARHLRLVADAFDPERVVYGQYWPKASQPEIDLFFDAETFSRDLDQIRAGNSTIIHNLLRSRFPTLVHELTHAYDDYVSGGKYQANAQSVQNILDTSRARQQPSPESKQRARTSYLRDPIEINARFTATVAKIAVYLDGTWSDYAGQFKETFEGWRQMDPTVQRRLLVRLATQWTAVHGRKPIDITPFVAKLNAKVQTLNRAIRVQPAHGNIEVSGLDSVPPRVQATVLHGATYLGDIFRRQVVTYDDVPMLKGFEFVRNRGRNKDYRISAPFYREPVKRA